MGDRFHAFHKKKTESPSKRGRARRLNNSRQPVRTSIAVVESRRLITANSQVLKGDEGVKLKMRDLGSAAKPTRMDLSTPQIHAVSKT